MSREMGCPDKPVASVSEDLFNVSTYVNGLCSFVRSCDTPMTISIQGDWGSGKTSMMNMMRENLQASIWPIWFNTWQFSQFDMGNSLVFSMMDVLLNGLDCDKAAIKKILGGISGLAKNVIRVATDRVAGGAAESMISDAISGEPTDFANDILELKNKFQDAVNRKLAKEHRDRVVIFVDDLDRLQPIKAVELLEVLKLFLDCDKCVFILAVDYEVVTLGIKEKFGDNVSEEKGKSFFDKIIQLPFKMPVAQYNVNKYVEDMLKRMSMDTSAEEIGLFTKLIKTSVGFNPRSMKRLFNTYQLLDIVSKGTIRGVEENVRRKILFATVCAQMCYEEFYLYLTSTILDVDTLTAFLDKSGCETALKEIYSETDDTDVDRKIRRLVAFIPCFMQALHFDNEHKDLTDEEVNNLSMILRCSVITSVSAENDNDNSALIWEYRDINKNLVKETSKLLADIGEFAVWMPRKEKDDIKLYDISGYYSWNLKCQLDIALDYYVSRIDDYRICVHLYITNINKHRRSEFFKILGENPLKLVTKPVIEDWGRYKYLNLLSLNDDDRYSAEQIAKLVRNAVAALNDID